MPTFELTPVTQSTNLNTMTVENVLYGVNALRAENTDDFLDATKDLYYINLAINALNRSNKYFFKEKTATYAVNTNTTRFYLWSTLVSQGDLKKPQELRPNASDEKDNPYIQNIDYKIEANSSGYKGVRFLTDITETIEILYYAYIPKVTATTETIDIPHEFNDFFIYKVLEMVYYSEKKFDVAANFRALADQVYNELVLNNFEEEVLDGMPSPFWL